MTCPYTSDELDTSFQAPQPPKVTASRQQQQQKIFHVTPPTSPHKLNQVAVLDIVAKVPNVDTVFPLADLCKLNRILVGSIHGAPKAPRNTVTVAVAITSATVAIAIARTRTRPGRGATSTAAPMARPRGRRTVTVSRLGARAGPFSPGRAALYDGVKSQDEVER